MVNEVKKGTEDVKVKFEALVRNGKEFKKGDIVKNVPTAKAEAWRERGWIE